MAARSGILTLVVLTALGASFALWATLRPTGPTEPAAGATASRGETQRSDPAPAPLTAPRPVQHDGRAAQEPLAEQPGEHEAPEEALPVRVVDADGLPLGGIPVAIFAAAREIPSPMPVVAAETREPDGLAWLASDLRGQELPADLRLTVGVELPLEPRVEHDLGGWIPGEPWEADTVELVLPAGAAAWLEPLQVVVVDARGAPVPGVEVRLVARQRLNPSQEHGLGRATTRAPDGVALISRDEMRDARRELAMLQVAVDHEVLCGGPFVPPPAVAVPGEPSPEPLRIVLPPTASVEARLVRPDGTHVEAGATVSLEWFARGSDRRAGYVNAVVEEGVARFERVGLGLDLRLGGTLEGGAARADRVELPGPLRAGETLRIDLELGPEYPLLVGRLLLPGGTPAAELSFNLATDLVDPPARKPSSGPRSLSWSYLQTDGEGRFAIPWSGSTTTTGRLLRIEERPHPKLGAPPSWVPHFAALPFPSLSGDGTRLDLGDVPLEQVPVVVAGSVVDVEGRPVNQAWLSLRYPLGEGQDMRWYNLRVPGFSRVPSREDGRFEVRSLQPMGVLRVSASQNRIGTSPVVEVRPGTIDVLLVLEADEDRGKTRGRLGGSVRIDPDIPMLELDVRLLGENSERSTYVVAGQFTFDGLSPGTYRLVVRTHRSDFLLDEVEGLVVQAGQETRDARLQGIDLRGRLGVLRARLLQPSGAPLARQDVWLVAGQGRGRLRTDDDGRLMALIRSQDIDLQLHLEGFEPLDVLVTGSEQVLTPVPQ